MEEFILDNLSSSSSSSLLFPTISSSHSCIVEDVLIVEIPVNERSLLCNVKDFGKLVFANVKLRRTGSGVRIKIFFQCHIELINVLIPPVLFVLLDFNDIFSCTVKSFDGIRSFLCKTFRAYRPYFL
ncbi:unnamed protein product [Rotaria sordida]|uniref:Uncharacterized protein n=1 Tax=Rotaria sordida TaxID=392033 RepID=A0A820AV64_9BILA|nr:unnamed protein product [Rotaria sordida]